MKSPKIRKILKTALVAGKALQIKRRYDSFTRYGYPVGLDDDWVLFHQIHADVMTLNGYMAVRLVDLETVKADTGFLMRALTALGERPLPQPEIILTDLPRLLLSANERFPLVTIHPEVRSPDACYIGRVEKMGKNTIHLWEITPEARWRKAINRHPYKDITLVEFGDGYANALWMLGQKEWIARNENSQDERNSP